MYFFLKEYNYTSEQRSTKTAKSGKEHDEPINGGQIVDAGENDTDGIKQGVAATRVRT